MKIFTSEKRTKIVEFYFVYKNTADNTSISEKDHRLIGSFNVLTNVASYLIFHNMEEHRKTDCR